MDPQPMEQEETTAPASTGTSSSEWIGIKEAAEHLGVHHNTIRHRIKTGVYHYTKTLTPNGEAYLIPRAEVEGPYPSNGVVPSNGVRSGGALTAEEFGQTLREALRPLLEERDALQQQIGYERARREEAERRLATRRPQSVAGWLRFVLGLSGQKEL